MNLNESDDVRYLTFKVFDSPEFGFLHHAFSTRIGGCSENEYSGMNLTFSTGDFAENVRKNFEIFCEKTDFEIETLVIPEQTHSNNVKIVNNSDCIGNNLTSKRIENTDGLITNHHGVTLVTFHADCGSLFFVDKKSKVIGLAHAGWMGTVKKIARNMVFSFIENFGSDVKNIVCCMGPAIKKCCFEIKNDILPKFKNMDLQNIESFIQENMYKNNSYNIDLFGINKQILLEAGLLEENIILSDLCTKCHPELFYSHRNSAKKRGSMAAFMSLAPQ